MFSMVGGTGILQWVGRLRLSQLAVILLILLAGWIVSVYVISERAMQAWKGLPSRGYGAQGGALHDRVPDSYIDLYMRALRDARPGRCLVRKYDTGDISVSILLHYNEDEFYLLKLALNSIVRNTPEELFTEIIIIDDGSVKKPVAYHALEFLKRAEYKKVRQYRSQTPGGVAASRIKAAGLAHGTVVVFVGGNVVVNRGWLTPLVAGVMANRRQIIAAHTDNFLSNARFFAMPDNYINVFTWALSTVFLDTMADDDPQALTTATPVMTGDVYAVDRAFLAKLGGHDADMQAGTGGGPLELSLRAWLCGDGVRIARCSRVAVPDALQPRRMDSPANFRRTVELWLDGYKHFAYTISGVSPDMSESERVSLRTRRAELGQLTCKPFSWFMQQHGGDLVVPSDRVVHFGKLKSLNGHCIHPAVTSSIGAVNLVLCRPHIYDSELIFEMDSTGSISIKGRCLRPDNVGYRLRLRECDETDPRQKWTLTEAGKLTSAAQPGLCLTHVQSPTHHALLQACDGERSQLWAFIKY